MRQLHPAAVFDAAQVPAPPGLQIQHIQTGDDLDRWVAFHNQHSTSPGTTREEMEAVATLPGLRRRWLALLDGDVVGVASTSESIELAPGSFHAGVRVADPDIGRGIRSALAEAIRAFIVEHGGRTVLAGTRDIDPAYVDFWAARGVVVVERHPAVELELAAVEGSPSMPVVDGLAIVTLAERPDLERPLWEAAVSSIWPDEPTDVEIVEYEPWEEFQKFVRDFPGTSPALVSVALVDGEIAGYLHLARLPLDPTTASHWYTGVCRGFRGRSIALALKLHGIEQSRSLGIVRLRTTNHERNAAMRHLNARLGYRQVHVDLNLLGPVW